jgi:hypothetical protein
MEQEQDTYGRRCNYAGCGAIAHHYQGTLSNMQWRCTSCFNQHGYRTYSQEVAA